MILLGSLFACKKNGPSKEYETLKTKPFVSMMASEKVAFKTELIKILRADSNYVKFDRAVRRMSAEQIKAHRHKNGMGKAPAFKTDLVSFYKEKNIANPQEYIKNKVLAIRYLVLLRKEYPELFHLDKATRKSVLSRASPQFKIVSILKEKHAKQLTAAKN